MHAVLQVLMRFPVGRALPQKLFGGYIGIVVFVVRDLKDALIDLCPIVVHAGKSGLDVGNCWLKVERKCARYSSKIGVALTMRFACYISVSVRVEPKLNAYTGTKTQNAYFDCRWKAHGGVTQHFTDRANLNKQPVSAFIVLFFTFSGLAVRLLSVGQTYFRASNPPSDRYRRQKTGPLQALCCLHSHSAA